MADQPKERDAAEVVSALALEDQLQGFQLDRLVMERATDNHYQVRIYRPGDEDYEALAVRFE